MEISFSGFSSLGGKFDSEGDLTSGFSGLISDATELDKSMGDGDFMSSLNLTDILRVRCISFSFLRFSSSFLLRISLAFLAFWKFS